MTTPRLTLTRFEVARGRQNDRMSELSLSGEERREMMRAHLGVVTALLAQDREAMHAQLRSVVQEETAAANGDAAIAVARMAKAFEAGALVTAALVPMIVKRTDLSLDQVMAILGQVALQIDIPE